MDNITIIVRSLTKVIVYICFIFYFCILQNIHYMIWNIHNMIWIHYRYWYCWYIYINKYHICVISKIFSGKFQIKTHFHLCYRKKLFKYIRILRSLKSMKRELIVHLKILLYFVLFTKKMKRNLKSWFQLVGIKRNLQKKLKKKLNLMYFF